MSIVSNNTADVAMGTLQAVTGGGRAAKGALKGAGTFAKRHQTLVGATAAFGAGSMATKAHDMAHSHPEFYDATPNKGRSGNRHPNGGGMNG